MRSDLDLFEAWGGGDRAAGNELVQRYVDVLYRFFRNKVRNDVSDLVQQTLLACVESKERLRSGSSFRSFLFGVARYTLYEHYRRQKRDALVDFMQTTAEGLGSSPSRALGRLEDEQLLLEALQRIPLESQIMLELLFQDEVSSGEVADIFGITGSAVRGRVSRALSQLRSMLTERAVEPPAHVDDPGTSWTAKLLREVRLPSVVDAQAVDTDEPAAD